ncbi:zinc-binding dehydrogenase [Saccharopolyspora tripterygii]
MQAVVAYGAGDLGLENRPVPTPGPDEVLIRIVYGGICGSDMRYAQDGRNGAYTIVEPLTLGHEVVGIVDRIGSAVSGSPVVGTAVAIHPATPAPPVGGREGHGLHLAPGGTYLGSASTNPHTQGGFVEYLAVQPGQLRRLPDGLPLRLAVLAEPLAVALHGVGRLGNKVKGARVLVNGAGPIGALAIAGLAAAGAVSITAADLQEHPLRIAREVGADTTVALGAGEKVESDAYDIVVEAAGAVPSLISGLQAVRPGGSVLQLGMLPAGSQTLPLAGLIAKEITLLGSQRFDVELDEAVALLASEPRLASIVSHEFTADEVIDAFACAADSSRSTKVILRFGEDPTA